jgi:hypothetical protein
MIKALLLIFEPAAAWERVVRAQRSTGFILVVYVLPLLAWAGAAEGFSLMHWGRTRQYMNQPNRFTLGEAIVYEVGFSLLTLVAMFVGAKIIKLLGETFHGRHTYTQAFTTVAYGLSPLLTCRLLDAFPDLSVWIGWAIGMLLSIGVLYQGLPRVMQPDPPHAFGLYMMSSILLTMTMGLARYLGYGYLQGDFKTLEQLVSRLVG